MTTTNRISHGFEQFVFPLKHDQVECKAPTVPPNGQNENPQQMPVCIEIPIVSSGIRAIQCQFWWFFEPVGP